MSSYNSYTGFPKKGMWVVTDSSMHSGSGLAVQAGGISWSYFGDSNKLPSGSYSVSFKTVLNSGQSSGWYPIVIEALSQALSQPHAWKDVKHYVYICASSSSSTSTATSSSTTTSTSTSTSTPTSTSTSTSTPTSTASAPSIDKTASHYAYQWVSQSDYPTVAAGSSTTMEVKLKNTGTATWYQDYVNLGTNKSQDRCPGFDSNGTTDGWYKCNRARLVESSVAPGATGTYRFTYTVPSTKGAATYREYFQPVVDEVTWMNDIGIYFDVKVTAATSTSTSSAPAIDKTASHYAYQWVSQSANPTVKPGESMTLEVKLKNTGTATWYQNYLNLGTNRPQDFVPGFDTGSGWHKCNRAQLVESSVAPGATGTFRFTWTVPTTKAPTTVRQYFQPVVDEVAWLSDIGIYFDVTVTK